MNWYAPLLTLAVLTAGCHASLPDAPVQPGEDPDFAAPQVATPPGMVEEPTTSFKLLAGDVVSLRIHSVEHSEERLSIDAAGILPVPLVGAVEVGGLDLVEAERKVTEALRTKDHFVEVSLTLLEPGGHHATVVGAVEHPGEFVLRPMTRVADLIAMSQGPKVAISDDELTELADLDGARVVRGGKELPLSVSKALAGDPMHNVRVRAGDVVYVPPSRSQRISVLGEVQKARVIPFRHGVRLTEALAMAGGSTELADNGDIRVVRGSLSHPRVYSTSLRALVGGDGHDVMLEPGDVVFVTEHWFATTTQVLQRLTPFLAAGALAVAVSK